MPPLDETRESLLHAGQEVPRRVKRMWSGFVDFAVQDNVLEVAVGLILAAAFTTVVTSFVSDILLPPLSLLPFINRNLDEKFAVLKSGRSYHSQDYKTIKQALEDGAVIMSYGVFFNKLISFLGVGLVLYGVASTYQYLSSDTIIRHTVKCKYCRKRISEKAHRCVNYISYINMKLIKQNIERDGSGTITLFPEEPEDMWHAYNLIATNDLLTASAVRRVVNESSTGSTSSQRVHMTLTIRVTSIDFDSHAGELHVSGRITSENKYVKIGSHHTLDLELNRNFKLEKNDGWDSIALDVVRDAIREDKEGTIPAVVMQEGFANICLITENQTVLKQRVEVTIPKKRQGRSGEHDKGMTRFYQTVLETLLRHVDITEPRPLLLASPGFVAEGFKSYIIEHATKAANKAMLSNRANFVVIHSSSGHLHSLNEVLKSPAVLAKLKDTKYARETQIMDKFMEMLRLDDGRAWYGVSEVEKAVEKSAVGQGGGVLLVNNSLFRSQDIGTRKRFVAMVDKVRAEGGEARVLSSDHESGSRLESLGNIAAILTFPLEDLDDDEEDGEEDMLRNGVVPPQAIQV